MKTANKKRDVLIVAVAASLIEGVLISLFIRQPASHNLSLLFLFHLPGILLVDWLRIPDPKAQVVIALAGGVQLFVLFLVGLIIWRQVHGRHTA
jgi:hypothetical protein